MMDCWPLGFAMMQPRTSAAWAARACWRTGTTSNTHGICVARRFKRASAACGWLSWRTTRQAWQGSLPPRRREDKAGRCARRPGTLSARGRRCHDGAPRDRRRMTVGPGARSRCIKATRWRKRTPKSGAMAAWITAHTRRRAVPQEISRTMATPYASRPRSSRRVISKELPGRCSTEK